MSGPVDRPKLVQERARLVEEWSAREPGLTKALEAAKALVVRRKAALDEATAAAEQAWLERARAEPTVRVDHINAELRASAPPEIREALEALEAEFDSLRTARGSWTRNRTTGREVELADHASVREWMARVPEVREQLRNLEIEVLTDAELAARITEIRGAHPFPAKGAME